MKRLLFLLLFFTACAHDVSLDTPVKTALQFNLRLGGGSYVLSRSIASEAENQLDAVSVYLFNDQGECIARPADFVQNGTTLTATGTWLQKYAGADVTAWFVGNPAKASYDLEHFFSDPYTDRAFADLYSDYNTAPLTPPLLCSARVPLRLPNAQNPKLALDVRLARRTARFDIVNTRPDELKLTRILIRGTALQEMVFADHTSDKTFQASDLPDIDAGKLVFAAPDYLAPSVFYLYPCHLGERATHIYIAGSIKGGPEQLFPVVTETAIEANRRYKLILDPDRVSFETRFTIEAAEYDEGTEAQWAEPTKTCLEKVEFTGGISQTRDGSLLCSDPGTIVFTFLCSRQNGIQMTDTCTGDFAASSNYSTTSSHETRPVTINGQMGYRSTITLNVKPNETGYSSLLSFIPTGSKYTAPFEMTLQCFDSRDFWAYSNVVYDFGKGELYFATSRAETAKIPENTQGMRFLSGSLVPLSPTNSFMPQWSASEKNYTQSADVPIFERYDMGPYNETFNMSSYNDIGFSEDEDKGDICRYISAQGWVAGSWRLPTVDECYSLLDNTFQEHHLDAPDQMDTHDISGWYACQNYVAFKRLRDQKLELLLPACGSPQEFGYTDPRGDPPPLAENNGGILTSTYSLHLDQYSSEGYYYLGFAKTSPTPGVMYCTFPSWSNYVQNKFGLYGFSIRCVRDI